MKKLKISGSEIFFIVGVTFLVGVLAGFFIITNQEAFSGINDNRISQRSLSAGDGIRIVETSLPAVNDKGEGVLGKLITIVRPAITPGEGLILVNINDVLAQADTQFSGRTAAKAASKFTNIDLSSVDIIYTIEVNASVIEGPSAGAAMAITVAAAMQNQSLRQDVMITGTINEDGSIGPIGAVIQKAEAAKENGASIFLVPAGQGNQSEVKRERQCQTNMQAGYKIEKCTIKYIPQPINIGNTLGIQVIEVKNMSEAFSYFQSEP